MKVTETIKSYLNDCNERTKGSPVPNSFCVLFCDPHLRTFFHCFQREGRERNTDVREKHQLIASRTHLDWGLNLQPRALNMQPFNYRTTLQSTEPHWSGGFCGFLKKTKIYVVLHTKQ